MSGSPTQGSNHPFLRTDRLELVLESSEAVLARIDALSPDERAEVSPEWLDRVRSSTTPSPWTHGLAIIERSSEAIVGSCGFKGPPDADGVVEIAYALDPAYQRRGFAREAAGSVCDYALGAGGARIVRAHTKSGDGASARVLTACGFEMIGEVVDPEDGVVTRWELRGRTFTPGVA